MILVFALAMLTLFTIIFRVSNPISIIFDKVDGSYSDNWKMAYWTLTFIWSLTGATIGSVFITKRRFLYHQPHHVRLLSKKRFYIMMIFLIAWLTWSALILFSNN